MFIMSKDLNGINTFGRTPDSIKMGGDLTSAGGDKAFPAVPATYKKWLAIFWYNPGSIIFVNINSAAVIPVGDPALCTSEGQPAVYELNAGDVIHAITSDTTAKIGVVLKGIKENY